MARPPSPGVSVTQSTLVFAAQFRPEDLVNDDTSTWPFHVDSNLRLVLAEPDSQSSGGDQPQLAFVMTRTDRVQRKVQADAVPGSGGEHVAVREWSGECTLQPGHAKALQPGHAKEAGGHGVVLHATFSARHRRNYHEKRAGEELLRDTGQDGEAAAQYEEALDPPVVSSGMVVKSARAVVVQGWGGDETVELAAVAV